MITRQSVIKCPGCGYFQMETMADGACTVAWECPNCGKVTRPREGDCCVYCSYASVPCPAAQRKVLDREAGARRKQDEEDA